MSTSTLPVDAQRALAGIVAAVEQANKPKPDAINKLVDERLAQVIQNVASTARTALAADSAAASAQIKGAAAAIVAAVQTVEAGMPAKVQELVIAALEKLAPRKLDCLTVHGTRVTLDEHTRPEFEEIRDTVALGLNTFLVGPAGCGKSHLGGQLARSMGLRFGFISLSGGVSESRLVGRYVPSGDNGRFQYVVAQFADFYENGGLFMLDEMDGADANTLLAINPALANGHMETPNPAKPIIQRHKDFYCVSAANTWGGGADRQYVGRNQLDASTLDRFSAAMFEIDYDEDYEIKVGDPHLSDWAHQLRRKVRQHGIRRVVSTRLILNGTRLMESGKTTLEQVQRRFLLNWTENEKRLVA
jgi:hypothetical protein